jgi:hypothetical protein
MTSPRVRLALGGLVASVALALAAGPAAAASATEPLCPGPEYRQFDFWIGDWDVTADGKPAGRNRVERILDGCAIQESWVGVEGMRGTSLNQYFERDHQWHQTWIDTNGMRLDLAGGLRDGMMVLEGRSPGREPGVTVRHRISWKLRPDGTVRQHWQASRDDGKTWKDIFDGIYRRRAAAPDRSR